MSSRFQVAPEAERTIDGITFDSKKEAKRYAELKLLVKAGHIKDLKLQTKFPVEIRGKHYCTYSCDFMYFDVKSGKTIIEDVKSLNGTSADPAFRLRKKAAELFHEIAVTEVFR